MANPKDSVTIKMSEELYNELSELKKAFNCTYNDIIEELLKIELKENYIKKIRDFIFITQNNEYVFRIIFKNQDYNIEYYDPDGNLVRFNDWISEYDKKLFNQFINGEASLVLLEYMGNSIEFDKYLIVSS